MLVEGSSNQNAQIQQVARTIEAVNELNRSIVDSASNLDNRMLSVNVEQRVGNPDAELGLGRNLDLRG